MTKTAFFALLAGLSLQVFAADEPRPKGPAGSGETPLQWAAIRGDAELAGKLLDRGAAVDAVNDLGQTALHAAAGILRARGASSHCPRGAERL